MFSWALFMVEITLFYDINKSKIVLNFNFSKIFRIAFFRCYSDIVNCHQCFNVSKASQFNFEVKLLSKYVTLI